jgi:uncharacterized protein
MKIGVISDTHNHFDPRIPALFAGVDHILHAGDICLPWIILDLQSIAPVTAVLGNNDEGLPYNETEVITLADRKFLIHHIVDVHRPSAIFSRALTRERPDIVIFGHTHKPFNQSIDNVLYFNPGYAGKPRFNQPRSLAILHCTAGKIRPEFINL